MPDLQRDFNFVSQLRFLDGETPVKKVKIGGDDYGFLPIES